MYHGNTRVLFEHIIVYAILLWFPFSNVVYQSTMLLSTFSQFQFNSVYNIYFSITVLWSSEKNSFIQSQQSH